MDEQDVIRRPIGSEKVGGETQKVPNPIEDQPTVREPGTGGVLEGTPPEIPAHRLLRCIGKGSYGTIWLAINAMGTYRAVKMVYRTRFEDDRPYEREYEGIKKFEPLSRSHDGFVDILQVERNDQAGYFYYVMELADDISKGQQIIPDTYIAKTLAGERERRGCLPLEECLQLGLLLSAALEYLHKNKLVHRDIKEANIVFINGTPKLADIGLVSDIRADSTFVGTPGFIPPEGPGAPAADIYSLGKVLYEISTGQDRSQFPSLPASGPLAQGGGVFREWHAILVKACAESVTLRYQSARELQAHLALVRAGKSVQRLLQFERSIALAKRYGPIAALLLLLIPLVLFQVVREKKHAAEDRQRQAGSYVAYGSRAFGEGEFLSALPWFVRALELDQGDPAKELTHRVRIASALQHSPRLIQMRFHRSDWNYAEFGATDNEILSPFADQRAAVWNVSSGKPLSPLIGTGKHNGEKSSFSRDFRKIVTCNADTLARVWDARTGELLLDCKHDGLVVNARFDPTGNRIVTTENGGAEAHVWSLATGERELLLRGHTNHLWYADFSPDGRFIVTTSVGGQAIVWDAATGNHRLTFTRHTQWVQYAAFSPDSRWVATVSGDHTARIWEADTGREVIPPLQHNDHVVSAQFSPDGRWLVTACLDGTAHIWNVETGQHALPTLTHRTRVEHAAFSPTGSRLVTVCIDGTICVWELLRAAPASLASPVAFSADGLRCAQVTNNEIQIHQALNRNLLASIPLNNHSLSGLLFDSEGKTLATTIAVQDPSGRAREEAQFWEIENGARPGPRIQYEASLTNLVLSSAGTRMAAYGGSDLEVWDTQSGDRLLATSGPSINHLTFDRSGNRFALAHNKAVELWSLHDHPARLISSFTNKMSVSHVEFSPEDQYVLTSCSDLTLNPGAARIWDAQTGQPAGPPLTHRDGVLYATFSPQGERIVTCGEDFTALLWETKSGRRLPLPPLKHNEQVIYAAFSRNGLWVLTIEKGGTVRIWDAFTGELVAPPLRYPARLTSAQFIAADRRLATRSITGATQVWELPRDDRPIPDLFLIAGLLSGQRAESANNPQAPAQGELRTTWDYLRNLYPQDFAPGR